MGNFILLVLAVLFLLVFVYIYNESASKADLMFFTFLSCLNIFGGSFLIGVDTATKSEKGFIVYPVHTISGKDTVSTVWHVMEKK